MRLKKASIVEIIEKSLEKVHHGEAIDVVIKTSLDDPDVWVDHEQMETAFFDLAQNAVEAMPDGGTLTIMIEGDDQRIRVSLADTGSGITDENMMSLLTPFFTTKPAGDGTGLGLAMAYSTFKTHGGSLSVESNADLRRGATGTIVKIAFPRHRIFQDAKTRIIMHEDD
ncbi:MAG TPA: ATP-binding protein [Syntrophales bacterium]|nr:ATP-binding protein [Syntrophales bacterium]